ncbi:cell division protein, partial [Streptomyces sp. NPDC055099]
MTDRQPPRRRVPGPARPSRPARPGEQRRQGSGPRPAARRPRPAAPRQPPRTIRLGSPRPRLRMVSLGLTLVMLAFVVRLLQVQAVDASVYTAKAEKNRYFSHVLTAERGGITDRRGVELAASVDAYDITADPTMFTAKEMGIKDAPEQAAALLAPILDKDVDRLTEQLKTPKTRYVLLARRQTPQVWKQIKDLRGGGGPHAGARPQSPPQRGGGVHVPPRPPGVPPPR